MAKVTITDALYEKIKKLSEIAGYSAPEEFIQHALEKEVDALEEGGGNEEEIKKKLQGLGYI
jgi:metal-responsive CopG/Arc/MetJ family transcriptional regulator